MFVGFSVRIGGDPERKGGSVTAWALGAYFRMPVPGTERSPAGALLRCLLDQGTQPVLWL